MNITRENVNQILDNGELYVAITNGNWYRARRNGKTRTWKKDTSRIYIPIKYGFRGTTQITETDFRSEGETLHTGYFRHIEDVPVNKR